MSNFILCLSRYKEHDDGMYRLQTVRFESVELSQQLDDLENEDDMDEVDDPDDADCRQTSEGSNHHELKNMTAEEYENQLRIERLVKTKHSGSIH